jgi:hypothetical protein
MSNLDMIAGVTSIIMDEKNSKKNDQPSTKRLPKPRRKRKKTTKMNSTLYVAPPTGVSTAIEFDNKVEQYEHTAGYCSNTPNICKFCAGKKKHPDYMTSKEYIHDDRCTDDSKNQKRGQQLKFNKFKHFTTRCCQPRNDALHTLVKYCQSRAGYKNARTMERLFVRNDEALRAKHHMVSFGYLSADYEEWCKTWPMKTAANPGVVGRKNSRDEARDEVVAGWVREFFELGSTKKRRVVRLPVSELPKAMNTLYANAKEKGLEISREHIHCASKFDLPDVDLQADYLNLSLADLYRQTGDFEKARTKTMVVLSVLGGADGKTTQGEKELLDSARKF